MSVEPGRRRWVAPEALARLDQGLCAELGVSRSRVSAWIAEGRVWVDGRAVAKAGERLRAGAVVEVEIPPPAPTGLIAEDIAVPLLFQDVDLVVVDKPAGLVVHPAKGHASGTLVNALLHLLGGESEDPDAPERPGIVHRIDKGTSGVLVVARTPEAHEGLARQFADHSAERRYLALVWGELRGDRGTVDAALGRHPRDRLRFAVVKSGGKRAVTHWERLGTVAVGRRVVNLVSCRLETGRTHQIRVHLTHLGHPLVGDPLYGPGHALPGFEGLDHQLLHAERLGFVHPRSGERLTFVSPLPDDFRAVLTALGLPAPT